jgi:hypothetical protein
MPIPISPEVIDENTCIIEVVAHVEQRPSAP